jgi:hypothetical protein
MNEVSRLLLQFDYSNEEKGQWIVFFERFDDGSSILGLRGNSWPVADVTGCDLEIVRSAEEMRMAEAASIECRAMRVRVHDLEGWATRFVRPLGRDEIYVSDDLVLLDDRHSATMTGYITDDNGYAIQLDFKEEARELIKRARREGMVEDELRAMVASALGMSEDSTRKP